MKKETKNHIMLATKATHKLGDISREKPDFCVIDTTLTTNSHYIGSWLEGLGFINIEFPKETTKELTPKELLKYKKLH